MSLERMYRKGVRQIRKRDARNLLNEQQQAAAKPVVEPKQTDEHGGDLPYEETNDNGWGTHTEYPNIKCPECPAKFHFDVGLDIHKNTAHNG